MRHDISALTLGAMFVALFAVAGNIPLLSSLSLFGVPFTLQIFLAAMMGYTLRVRGGLTALLCVYLLTFFGVPLMAGGRGGPAVFVSATAGYIIGFVFVVLFAGLGARTGSAARPSLPRMFVFGLCGVLLDYLCGALWLMLTAGRPVTAVLWMNFGFLPFDTAKIVLAAALSRQFYALKRRLSQT
ncbi:MAG: biotin transporter BioY [Oscillospiraceae bacterium]|nr:biotin transporter BioY [Oscillospiraceae bacterium]